MAIETKIDGGKQAITFNNDTEPCAVYVNGELQENVSFVPQMVQGTNVVSYESEYKKNHIEIEIDGNTTQSILPREYQEVEYIESTGTQYIDTGILASPVFKMEADFQFTYNYLGTTEKPTNGTVQSPSYIAFGYNTAVTATNFYLAYSSYTVDTSIPFDTKKHRCVIQGLGGSGNTGRWNIDGSVGDKTGIINGTFSKGTLPFILFARNSKSGIGGFAKMRLFAFKFYEDNIIIRDFIPCYRKADNVIGLYDLVNGVFYTNQGTGTFLKGTDYSTPPTPGHPQPIENANSEGMSVVLRGSNFFNAQMLKSNDFSVNEDGSEIIANTQVGTVFSTYKTLAELCPNLQVGDVVVLQFDTNSVEKGILLSEDGDWYIGNSKVITQAALNSQVEFLCFGAELPIYYHNMRITYGNESGTFNPYFEPVEITIPASVNGIPLSFAGGGDIADKLVVDRINNKVEYIQKFAQYQMQGDEVILGTATTTNGYTEATFILPSSVPDDSKYLLQLCTVAQNAALATSGDRNLFEVFEGNGYCLARFKFLNCASEADMRNIFIDKVNSGEPVAVQYVLATPISHTLSGTTFGQALLNLATENQTNYIEVTGNANAPEIPIKLTYAKWGGNS